MSVIERTTVAQARLTVSEVARAAEVAPSAVRFYDRHGVVESVRTSSNQRRFGDVAACRIKVAKVAQRVGLTVGEIRDLLAALPPQPTTADWSRVSEELIETAERRIADLKRVLGDVDGDAPLCEVPIA